MEAWLAVVPTLLTLLGSFRLLRRRLRLRRNISQNLEIIDRLRAGAARHELELHVDRQVRMLIAEEQPWTVGERREARWYVAFVALGIMAPLVFSPLSGIDNDGLLTAGVFGGSILVSYALMSLRKVQAGVVERREALQLAIESGANGDAEEDIRPG